MKRKISRDEENAAQPVQKFAKTSATSAGDFASGLFDKPVVEGHRLSYTNSAPYKHAVVQPLISDHLLRSVRQEIIDNIHFTTKETDIYRIFQSGDLANLDGLPESALEKLPSLLRLRDALYSADFRSWISTVSGAGLVSGKKTDMAINVYKPGCHLLCHDDVIGSRRISYILYLTDPDLPWKASWGGALRLYPTTPAVTSDGRKVKVPDPAWTKTIPPAWNQLSFFAVQPGESFHDVEEVYHRSSDTHEEDGGRVRMAISGWFHIPQEGEEGYEEGLEEKLAERSSLQQLQAKNDTLDRPQQTFRPPQQVSSDSAKNDIEEEEEEEGDLTQADLDFLLKFMTPQYLTPETVEELNELFAEESSLQLANILSSKIIPAVEKELLELEHLEKNDARWETASPPHKHRYLFRQPTDSLSIVTDSAQDQLGTLVNQLLSSTSFHRWLSLVTGLSLGDSSIVARRFRRGLDYTLATAHEDSEMQLEYCLNLTPSKGWTTDDAGHEDETLVGEEPSVNGANGHSAKKESVSAEEEEGGNVGGYELYMAGDDADAASDDEGSDHGVTIPAGAGQAASSSTGGGHRRAIKSRAADPAVYKASAEGADEDDGILFTSPASWNTLSIVLRDKGTLKFVKYVSQNAPGDRWDIEGCVQVVEQDDDDDDDDDADSPNANGVDGEAQDGQESEGVNPEEDEEE